MTTVNHALNPLSGGGSGAELIKAIRPAFVIRLRTFFVSLLSDFNPDNASILCGFWVSMSVTESAFFHEALVDSKTSTEAVEIAMSPNSLLSISLPVNFSAIFKDTVSDVRMVEENPKELRPANVDKFQMPRAELY
jgi:hypothetical protein